MSAKKQSLTCCLVLHFVFGAVLSPYVFALPALAQSKGHAQNNLPSLDRSMLDLKPIPLRLAAVSPAQAAMEQASRNRAVLSPVGRDIAEQIGVLSTIDELVAVRDELPQNPTLALKHLELKHKLTQSVLIASLQVRDATARIDHEVAFLNRLSGGLEDQRDRAIKTNTMANIFGNGALNEIGQVGEMKVKEEAGEIVELVSGGLVMALGTMALRQQNGVKKPVPSKPNMLAKILDCRIDSDTDYPPVIWNYLNRPPVGAKSIKTRLQLLVEQWQKYNSLEKIGSPKTRRRNAELSNTAQQNRVNLDLLGDRIDMLNDVKAEVFQMDRDLLELLLNVQNL